MAEASGQLWLRQAEADLAAAGRSFLSAEASTYCQAIAKYQQTIEKSAKALAAALCDAGMATIPIGFKHDVETQISMLLRLPRPRESRDIQNIIYSLFDQTARADTKALGRLAPKAPAPGQPFQRNTEYPYQDAAGTWRVPADDGSFTLLECDRFKRLAHCISDGTARIMSAVERANLHQ